MLCNNNIDGIIVRATVKHSLVFQQVYFLACIKKEQYCWKVITSIFSIAPFVVNVLYIKSYIILYVFIALLTESLTKHRNI